MGVRAYTEEFTSPVAPARLFKAIFTDAQTTMPKIMPQYVKRVELESGGCITKTTYVQSSQSPVRHKIDSFDSKNLTIKYTLIQGDMLDEKFLESVSYYVRFEPAINNGCVIKATCEYRTKVGTDIMINVMEKNVKECKAMAAAVTMAVGDYLLRNPSFFFCAC